jgi:hypothetical protein
VPLFLGDGPPPRPSNSLSHDSREMSATAMEPRSTSDRFGSPDETGAAPLRPTKLRPPAAHQTLEVGLSRCVSVRFSASNAHMATLTWKNLTVTAKDAKGNEKQLLKVGEREAELAQGMAMHCHAWRSLFADVCVCVPPLA